jgi:hypothetical protein
MQILATVTDENGLFFYVIFDLDFIPLVDMESMITPETTCI